MASSGKRRRANIIEEAADQLPPWDAPSAISANVHGGCPLTELAEILRDPAHSELRPALNVPPEYFETFTVKHEDDLLREPWPSDGAPGVHARLCVFGRRCVAMRLQIPGAAESGGVVLAETMTPAELDNFRLTGEHPPSERRPCLLCTRAHATYEYVRFRRVTQGTGGPPYALNWFANPTGDGGYVRSYCLPFAEDGAGWNGIYGKIAALLPQRLALVQDLGTRRWRVDQSAMLHEGQRFDGDTAHGAFASTFGATLCRFVERRPAIWDGKELMGAWGACPPDTPGAGLRLDLEYRAKRFAEFVEAYGVSVGPDVTRAFARAQDLISAITVALSRGLSEEEAIRARPPSEDDLPDTTTVIMHALTVGGAASCARARCLKNADMSRTLIASIISRAAMYGGPPRAVFETANKALADSKASSLVSKLVVCSLLGGYNACTRRPRAHVRARLIALSDGEVAKAAKAFPSDAPLVMMATIEHVAAFVERNMHTHLPDIGASGPEWIARKERAQVFFDVIRANLEDAWPEGVSLADVFSKGPLFEQMQKLQKRSQKIPVRVAPSVTTIHPQSLGQLTAAVSHVPVSTEVFEAVSLQLSQGTPPDLAKAGMHRSTAALALDTLRANTASNCAKKRESTRAITELSAEQLTILSSVMRAYKGATALRRVDLPDTLCAVQKGALRAAQRDPASPVLLCVTCFSIKNVVAESDNGRKPRRPIGFIKMLSPSPLDDFPEPRCDCTAACQTTPLRTVPMFRDGKGGLLLCHSSTITSSPCCGMLCTLDAVRVSTDGGWMCCRCCPNQRP